jgi:hypothetical protein
MKFNVYADPGHAWCKVPRKLLNTLGIGDEISSCSYQRGDSVYLEEDGDLGVFYRAMQSVGKTVEFREFHTDRSSKIRSYFPYTP